MSDVPAFLATKDAVKRDLALQARDHGARKLLVTDLYGGKERESTSVEWLPPAVGEKCPVQVMADAEIAVFNQHAAQDRHYHKQGTEIYMILEGKMVIDVVGRDYLLLPGDMIVVNPNAIHEVKPQRTKFLCRVVTLNCGGTLDKFMV